jgi:hypothetical protein
VQQSGHLRIGMKEDEQKVLIAAATAGALGLAGIFAWRQFSRSKQVGCWLLLQRRHLRVPAH